MNKPGIILLAITLFGGGLGATANALADPEDHMGYGSHHMMGDDGMGYGHQKYEDMPHHRGYSSKDSDWKSTLTDEQRAEIAKLKLAYKKQTFLLKSKIKQANIEFALLITDDSPDNSAINKKIDQITRLKAEKLRIKADHKIKIRKILTPEQRVKFDMSVLNHANRDSKR